MFQITSIFVLEIFVFALESLMVNFQSRYLVFNLKDHMSAKSFDKTRQIYLTPDSLILPMWTHTDSYIIDIYYSNFFVSIDVLIFWSISLTSSEVTEVKIRAVSESLTTCCREHRVVIATTDGRRVRPCSDLFT